MTSFVIDGELFYTGVISELSRHRPRGNSISSGSDPDSSVKQRVSTYLALLEWTNSSAHTLTTPEVVFTDILLLF